MQQDQRVADFSGPTNYCPVYKWGITETFCVAVDVNLGSTLAIRRICYFSKSLAIAIATAQHLHEPIPGNT